MSLLDLLNKLEGYISNRGITYSDSIDALVEALQEDIEVKEGEND